MSLDDAIRGGNVAQVNLLLASGVDVNLRDGDGHKPIEIAITYQNLEMVMVLLRNGADVNASSDDGSVLHLAVRLHSVEIVRALLDNGADVNSRHQDESPLHHALRVGRIDVIELLLMQENINIYSPERLEGPGLIPLLFALPYHKSVVDLLVKRNVGITGVQETLLYWAAKTNGYEEMVQSLLNQGCPVDAIGELGRTPLHAAVFGGSDVAVSYLLKNGADPLSRLSDDTTSLDLAVSRRHRAVVRTLLEMSWPSFDPESPFSLDETVDRLLGFKWIDDLGRGKHILDYDLPPKLERDFHQPRCAHRILETASNLTTSPDDQGLDTPFRSPADSDFAEHNTKLDDLQMEITYLCGLGGVLPPSIKDDDKRSCGSTKYIRRQCISRLEVVYDASKASGGSPLEGDSDGISRPRTSYHPKHSFSTSEIDNLLKYLTDVAARIVHAIRTLQHGGFCCNSFTILVPQNDGRDIGVVPISIGLLDDLFATLTAGKSRATVDFTNIQAVSEAILKNFYPPIIWIGTMIEETVERSLHLCSIALQALAIGLVTYTLCHSVEFCSTSVQRAPDCWLLRGAGFDGISILVRQIRLACLNGMVRKRVWVFCGSALDFEANEFDIPIRDRWVGKRAPLATTITDFIDTWGRAILYASSTSSGEYYAANIGGGIIVPEKDQHLHGRIICHWTQGIDLYDTPKDRPRFRSSDVLVIGFTSINNYCQLDQNRLTSVLHTSLYNIGTQNPHMIFSQFQLGGQGGLYGVFQFSGVWKRHPGSTLKQAIMESWQIRDLEILYMPVGLELSICTGIARRALLKDLFNIPGVQDYIRYIFDEEWKTLTAPRNLWNPIFESKSKSDFREAVRELKKDMTIHACLVTIVNHVLKILQKTGVDSDCRNIQFWWPEAESPPRGISVPRRLCGMERPWLRMLRESVDCAVFAVASAKCVQSPPLKACCQSATPPIPVRINILETSIVSVGRPTVWPAASLLVLKRPILQGGQRYLLGNAGVLVAKSLPGPQPPLQLNWEDSVLPPFLTTSRAFVREKQRYTDDGQDVFVL